MKIRTVLLALGVSVVLCSPAMAHSRHGLFTAGGLMAGFAHPLLGLDHLLAMLAVGMLGVRLGGRATWLLPVAFLGPMMVGGICGMIGSGLPFVEIGIALSVVVLGAAFASGRNCPLLAAAIAVAAIGMLHGHAHGTEMPAMAGGALYATGFIASTAGLLLTGIVAGTWLVQPERRAAPRWSGAAICAAGLLLMLAAV